MLTFQISCKYLWGYTNIINISSYHSKQEIINTVLSNYERFLREYNLMDLVDILNLNKKKFHIHGISIQTLKEMDNTLINETPIYICCHT